jgi:Organic solute transporter Ostalpha
VEITIITAVSTAVALISTIRFYNAMKKQISHRKLLSKLIAFKAIVFLTFIQNTLFSFLASSGDLHPTSQLTFLDLTTTIPHLIISLEMVLFSLAFLYVYGTKEYCIKKGASAVPLGHGGYQGGILGSKALLEAMNPVDLVRVARGLVMRRRGGQTWLTRSQVSSRSRNQVRTD